MTIGMLYDYPEFTDTVIKWLNREFGDEKSFHFYKGIIEHSLEENRIPITFVAFDSGELLGTVGIWRGDLLSRQDLFPWLSALVVNPQYRNKGIGQMLQKFALQYCQSKGIKEIFLYTDLVGYYEKSGWVLFDSGYEYSGQKITIYRHGISNFI